MDNPSIFEDVGFFAPEGSFLADPCISLDFTVDGTAEIMGTQVSRCCHGAVRADVARPLLTGVTAAVLSRCHYNTLGLPSSFEHHTCGLLNWVAFS